MSEISCIYTVQIVPRTDKVPALLHPTLPAQDSVEVVIFDGSPENTKDLVVNYFRSR
jgi:hypothetical protein